MNRAKTKLDSITNLIRIDSLSFEEAAYQFSQDGSKNNGGLLINPQTGTSSFAIEEIEPSIYFALEKMEKNQISEPLVFTSIDQRKGYRILFLNERTVSHRANLKDDYDRIRLVAEQELKNKTSKEWVNNTINETFILIKEDYQCTFTNNWK